MKRSPSPPKASTPKFKTVTHREPYTVTVRDDRLSPGRAIPAAAMYLAGMEQKFGGRDWAIFAYHCGQGCVGEMLELTRRAHGIPKDQVTVPRMFFSSSPAWNRELYQAVSQQMQRDYSPTYYFRVRRAEQLLDLYRRDPAAFAALHREYKSEFAAGPRAPHRLAVWLRRDDLVFRTDDDIRSGLPERWSRPSTGRNSSAIPCNLAIARPLPTEPRPRLSGRWLMWLLKRAAFMTACAPSLSRSSRCR